jgi:adenosine deaminase
MKSWDEDSKMDWLARLPKVELHVHLEGATDAETVCTMAGRNGIKLPADSLDGWREHYRFKDFNHFIEVYGTATAVMRTPEDWELMVERFLRNQSRQNIIYSEVFLSASYQVGNLPLDEWTAAIAEGAARGEKAHGTRVRFIPDISRHLPNTQEAVLQCTLRAAKDRHFIGLGLGGIEEGFPAGLFADTYEEARRQGLRVVAHAGETTGAQTIWDAIRTLHAERIGHGIRCLDDVELVAHLRESQLPLEVCPTSNYCLGVVERNQPHPLRRMVDAGLFCTVNSDDPPMFGTSLVDEFHLLARQGFTCDELRQINQNAVEASFLSSDEKDVIRTQIWENNA